MVVAVVVLVFGVVVAVWQRARARYLRSWQVTVEDDRIIARHREDTVVLPYASICRIDIFLPRPLITVFLLIARPERDRSDQEQTFRGTLPLGTDVRSQLRRVRWLTAEFLLLAQDGRFLLFPIDALTREQVRQLHGYLVKLDDPSRTLEAERAAWTSLDAGAAALHDRDWVRAIRHFQEAIAAQESLGHIDSVATSLTHVADCHLRLRQLTQAAGHASRALGLVRNLRNERLTAYTLNQLAEVGVHLGSVHELRRAVQCLEEAVAIHERRREHFFVARMRANLALAFEKLFLSTGHDDDLARCERTAGQSLADLERPFRIPNKFLYYHQKANILGTLARCSFHRGDWRRAADQFQRASDVAQSYIARAQIFAEDQALWGRSLFLLGDMRPAFERLCTAVSMSRDLGTPDDYVRARVIRGDCYWDLNNPGAAVIDYEAAIKMMEGSRAALDQAVERNHFMRVWRHVFERTVEGLLQLAREQPARRAAYQERAFQYAQLAKARSLSETMTLSDALLDCLEESLRERLQSSRRLLAEARARIEYPSADNDDAPSGWMVLQEAEAKHKALLAEVEQHHPDLAAMLAPGTFTAADICRWLPRGGNGGAAVLEFLLTQGALCVFLLRPGSEAPLTSFRMRGLGRARWAQEFGAFEQAYEQRNGDRSRHPQRDVASPDAKAQPREPIWTEMLPDVIARLKSLLSTRSDEGGDVLTALRDAGVSRLVLVPDGQMHRLPLHAAIEAVASIMYCPSCSAMIHAAKHGIRVPRTALVVANPSHGPGSFMHAAFEAELEVVVNELTRMRITVGQLMRGQATGEAIVEKLRDAELFHFAGHAVADLASPLDSHLKVAGHDARLGVRELVAAGALRRGAWIVLDACETGLVSVDTSSEFLGLPGAFLTAGAGLVVSTLWPIKIEGPAELLRSAYARMREAGMPLGRALRAAVDQLRASACPPADWAPYVIYGVDWSADEVARDAAAARPVRIEPPLRVARNLSRTELTRVTKAAWELVESRHIRQAIALLEGFRASHGPLEGTDDILAQCYSQLDMSQAELAIRRSLVEQDPNNYRHHFNLGHTWLECGNVAAAQEAFRQTLALNPGHPRAADDLRKCT